MGNTFWGTAVSDKFWSCPHSWAKGKHYYSGALIVHCLRRLQWRYLSILMVELHVLQMLKDEII